MSTAVRTYSRGRKLVSMRDVQAGTSRYYHYDHQGTTQCLTDGAGAVTDRYSSDAWGVEVKRTGTSINRNWYRGNAGVSRDRRDTHYPGFGCSIPECGRFLTPFPPRIGTHPALEGLGGYSQTLFMTGVVALLAEVGDSLYHLEMRDLKREGPVATNPCGGAHWSVEWYLKDAQGKRPHDNKQEVYGWVIQHVKVTSSVKDCSNPPKPITEAAGAPPTNWEYWEIWPYSYSPSKIYVSPKDDTFGFPGMSVKSQGNWKISGDAIFFQGARPQVEGGWKKDVECNKLREMLGGRWLINLSCSEKRPDGFDKIKSRVKHSLEMGWTCGCGPGCVCESCTATAEVTGRESKTRRCGGGICPED